MTTIAAPAAPDLPVVLRRLMQSRWLWCIAAVAFVLFRDIGSGLQDLRASLGDTDDATRLVQVRQLMAGGGWYDLTLPRLGFLEPLVSHWSRLIDVPIAALLGLFGLVLAPANAELAARIVWPYLLLLAFLRLALAETERRGGATAAGLFLVLAVTCLTGLFQFRAGRIDHHNAMILGTVCGLLAMLRAFAHPRAGWWAGALLGLALAIGYEPLALTLPALGLAALACVVDPEKIAGFRNTLTAMAAMLAAVLAITVPPWNWAMVACDALALNMVLLVGTGAATLAVLGRLAPAMGVPSRLLVLALGGLVAGGAYLAAGPDCIGGPYAMVSADARQLWLVNVVETQSVWATFATNPTPMAVFLIFALAGIAAAAVHWRRAPSPDTLAILVLVVGALLPALWQTKFIPYSSWLAAITLALALASAPALATLSAPATRLIGALALNQSTLALVAAALLMVGGTSREIVEGKASVDTDACRSTPAIQALASLPVGRMANQIDLGPYIVALTPHSALSGPYHRIDRAIVATHGIFRAPPAEAARRLQAIGADYLVACIPPLKDGRQTAFEEGVVPGSLHARLAAGETPSFLAEVRSSSGVPAQRVWRVTEPAAQR